MERPSGAAFKSLADVMGQHFGFAQGELRSRRARLTGPCVDDRRAISERPESMVSEYRHRPVDNDCAALVALNRRAFEQRIRRGARSPHQGLSANGLAAEHNDSRLGVRQTRVQTKLNAACLHPLLRVAAQGIAQLRKDSVARVNKNRPKFGCVEVRVIREDPVGEVVDGRSR